MKHLLLALAATLLSVPALAADPFTVAKVPVDATAESAIQAQTRAVQNGYLIAARELLNRLTLEGERAERGLPELSIATVGPLIRGQTIDNERRSATRYLGDVSISFNPSAVQTLLRRQGLTMITSQASPRLAVPIGITPNSDLGRDILSGRYAHSLSPVLSPSADDMRALAVEPTSEQLRSLAARYDVDQVLVLRSTAGRLSATDLSLSSGSSNQLSSSRGLGGLVAQLESAWKATSAVPSSEAISATVTVLYTSQSEWQRLQTAINNSAQVRDARLDALSKDGALMTLSFGSVDRLAAEMAQKGVRVYEDPQLGLVVRR